jgi:signal transduction histidine kinase
VDLMLAALLAERAFLEGSPNTAPIHKLPTSFVPRIGEYLMDQGLLSRQQLDSALSRQKELSDAGHHRLLGQTLIDLDYVNRETLDRAINQQILELNAALQEANKMLEQRVAERTTELQKALEKLTELNQLKANLISNVSHELRTPLAHMKGYLELIGDGDLGPLTEKQKQGLDVMQRASLRLEKLIEDLIEFSTASREGLTLRLAPLEISPLVRDVFAQSQEKARNKDVELALEIPDSLPEIFADGDRIRWVLVQLLDNAIKFTPEGGDVTLSVMPFDKLVMFNVRDTGIGIPEDRQGELFEPFHQLDGSATRSYGGTGIGLALVKLILDSHGTDLKIKSAPGEGSQFGFVLPLAREML